ncbi:hypothetical protein F2P81_026015 [Scophthalmus maximus]|uniref:Uncharacterized protein n=1 Tax=Scophthalmus maximus TaxID=52904 RepID=A0A6A4RRS5_SCOMX|nr:hypothetical protein F2P81_026015 [Scophthalmus maximus]
MADACGRSSRSVIDSLAVNFCPGIHSRRGLSDLRGRPRRSSRAAPRTYSVRSLPTVRAKPVACFHPVVIVSKRSVGPRSKLSNALSRSAEPSANQQEQPLNMSRCVDSGVPPQRTASKGGDVEQTGRRRLTSPPRCCRVSIDALLRAPEDK